MQQSGAAQRRVVKYGQAMRLAPHRNRRHFIIAVMTLRNAL